MTAVALPSTQQYVPTDVRDSAPPVHLEQVQANLPIIPSATDCEASSRSDSGEDLLLRWQAGESNAATNFYRLYQPRVYRWACFRSSNFQAAEDLCQEVWHRITRSLSSYAPGTNPRAWIYKIVINTRRSIWRRGRNQLDRIIDRLTNLPVSEDCPAVSLPFGLTPETAYLRKQLLCLILHELRAIPKEFSEVILLRLVEGLSTDEVAEALNLSEGTVKSRLHRGLEKLRDRLGLTTPARSGEG